MKNQLLSISKDKLELAKSNDQIKPEKHPRPRDGPLAEAIYQMNDQNVQYIKEKCSTHFPKADVDFTFTNLFGAFRSLRAFISRHGYGQLSPKIMLECPSVYTESTVIEFHYFLLAVLLDYEQAIIDLKRTTGDPVRCNNRAWMFAYLLLRIAHSTIL